jgi:hypothetical protein
MNYSMETPSPIVVPRAFNNLVGMFPSLDQKLFVDLMVKENDGSMGPYPSEKDEHYCLVGDAQNPYWHHFHWPWPWPWPEAILDGVKQVILHAQPKTKEVEQAWSQRRDFSPRDTRKSLLTGSKNIRRGKLSWQR